MWVVRGAGNGTFSSSQVVPTGAEAHGVAVLDVDGDGDLDIVDALAGDERDGRAAEQRQRALRRADLLRQLCSGEWGLASGDMNDDGITDLVVGCVGDQKISVMLGNGDGTFTVLAAQNAGGTSWQVALGDVDGDGDLDATAANAFSTNGGALLSATATARSAPRPRKRRRAHARHRPRRHGRRRRPRLGAVGLRRRRSGRST